MCDYSKKGRCRIHANCEENGIQCKHYQIVTFPRVGECLYCNEYNCFFEFPVYEANYDI